MSETNEEEAFFLKTSFAVVAVVAVVAFAVAYIPFVVVGQCRVVAVAVAVAVAVRY